MPLEKSKKTIEFISFLVFVLSGWLIFGVLFDTAWGGGGFYAYRIWIVIFTILALSGIYDFIASKKVTDVVEIKRLIRNGSIKIVIIILLMIFHTPLSRLGKMSAYCRGSFPNQSMIECVSKWY